MTTRFFLWLVGLFAAAIGLAVLARFNPGNVVLFYPPHRIDISLNFFIVILLLSFLLLLLIVNTVRATMALPRRVQQYRAMRQLRESGRALQEALRAYFEGRFGRVEKSARKAAQSAEYAGLAALLGARAAQRLQEPSRRDQWLSEAATDTSLRTARLMSTVDLLSEDNKDLDAALAALHELSSSGIRHAHALRLALKVNQSARNWPEVLRLVHLLDKHNALHPTLSRRLRDLAYEALLPKAAEDAESLKKLWATIPAVDRQSSAVASLAATAFMKIGRQQDAADILQKALAVSGMCDSCAPTVSVQHPRARRSCYRKLNMSSSGCVSAPMMPSWPYCSARYVKNRSYGVRRSVISNRRCSAPVIASLCKKHICVLRRCMKY